jgi:CRP-like cAMP-binding protein
MATLQTLARRSRRVLRRLTDRSKDARVRSVAELLRRTALLCDLPSAVLLDLAEVAHERRYARDEILYYQGDPGLGLYVVRSGRVRLLADDSYGGAQLQEVRVMEEGDYFGDLSVVSALSRRETAQALTDAEVVGLFSPSLRGLTRRAPSSSAAFYEGLARNLAERQAALLQHLDEEALADTSARPAPPGTPRQLYDAACSQIDAQRLEAASLR